MLQDGALLVPLYHNSDDLLSILKQMETTRPETFSFYYATTIPRFEPNGFFIDSTDWIPDDDWLPPNRPWYQEAVKNGSVISYIDPYVDSMTLESCITLAQPIYNEQVLLGVIAADINVDNLSKMINAFKISENSKVHIVDEFGMYITNEDLSAVMGTNDFDESALSIMAQNAKSYLTKDISFSRDNKNYYGVAGACDKLW